MRNESSGTYGCAYWGHTLILSLGNPLSQACGQQ